MKKNCFSLLLVLTYLTLSFFSFSASANTVSSAQSLLQQMGYYQGVVDGHMGSRTSAAIRRFQVANKLRPTGTLTDETLENLALPYKQKVRSRAEQLSSQAKHFSYHAPGNRDPKALADIFVGGPLLAASPAIQLATVQKAQSHLKTLGYYHGPINGYPDTTLKTALKTYQKASRFKATGRLDKITLMGLNILPGVYHPGR